MSNPDKAHDQTTIEADVDGKASQENRVLLSHKSTSYDASHKPIRFIDYFKPHYRAYTRLSFREQILILGLSSALILILYLILRWVPLQATLADERKRLEQRNEDLKELILPTVNGDTANTIKARLEKLQRTRDELLAQTQPLLDQWISLNNPAALEQLKLAISTLATQSGLDILVNKPVIHRLAKTPEDLTAALDDPTAVLMKNHGRSAVQYEMRGPYSGLRRFLSGLNELPRRVSLGRFDIAVYDPRTEAGRNTLNITVVLAL